MLAQPAEPIHDRTRFPVDEWKLRETRFSSADLGETETLFALGNGYLGMRGNYAEGRDSHTHGTFINGFHETWPIHHPEEAYAFAKTGQTIVNAPDVKTMRLYLDDEPLLLSVADLEEYERTLDFRAGTLTRELIWRTPSGKKVQVTTTRLVSLTHRHIAAINMRIRLLDADAPVVLRCQVLNRQDGQDEYHVREAAMGEGFDPRRGQNFDHRVLHPQEFGGDDQRIFMSYRTHHSGMTLAVAVEDSIETENHYTVSTVVDADRAEHTYKIDAVAGQDITVTRFVTYHSSRGVPTKELITRCHHTLERICPEGFDGLAAEQRAELDEFWAVSDVQVAGQPEIQQALRWNLFQLCQAAYRAEGMGIGAKGVTGSGYGGHYFWDQEIYALPFFTYTNPQVARNALRFRYLMLDAARRRAREMTQDGALFPWRTINGEEASAYYAAGTAQYHIDADISYALTQYVWATGDQDFMTREGIDILVETARMWVDLGFWRSGEDRSFNIHGVTGPDEYTTVVDNNLFTNVMARQNLWQATDQVRALATADPEQYAHLCHRLGLEEFELQRWQEAADAMFIPYDDGLKIHPQDAHFLDLEVWDLKNTPREMHPLLLHFHPLVIYRFQVIKQADVVLALFLQGQHFSDSEKLANFEYYDPLTTGDSTLSAASQAIIAAEVGYQDLAYEYFRNALNVDLANLHRNTVDGVHVASTGGVWSAVVCGFGGMRDHDGKLSFDPRLPREWESLSFRLQWHGVRLTFVLYPDVLQVSAAEPAGRQQVANGGKAHEVKFEVRGNEYAVQPGQQITIALDGQGPHFAGRPSPAVLVGHTRDDGSVVTASVPHAVEALEPVDSAADEATPASLPGFPA